MDIKKIITILNYLSINVPNLCKLKASKLLYFADKEHFIKYGRFITGDVYKRLKYGPIPSNILNIINRPESLPKEQYNYLDHNITFSNNSNRTILNKCDPEMDELSDSEIEILDRIINKFKFCSSMDLYKLSHKEYAWLNSKPNETLTPEKIAHGINKEQLKELLEIYDNDRQ